MSESKIILLIGESDKKKETFAIKNLPMKDDKSNYYVHPETNLSPKKQSLKADQFIKMMKSKKTIIINSHSEYILMRILRRIAESVISEKEVDIYYDTGKTIKFLKVNKFGIIEEYPNKFFYSVMDDTIRHSEAVLKRKFKEIQNG